MRQPLSCNCPRPGLGGTHVLVDMTLPATVLVADSAGEVEMLSTVLAAAQLHLPLDAFTQVVVNEIVNTARVEYLDKSFLVYNLKIYKEECEVPWPPPATPMVSVTTSRLSLTQPMQFSTSSTTGETLLVASSL